MSAQTTPDGLPFPSPSDPPNGPAQLQALADATQAALLARVSSAAARFALVSDSGQIGPGYAQLGSMPLAVEAGGLYVVQFSGRFRLAAAAGSLFVHLRDNGTDVCVAALNATTTGASVAALAVLAPTADAVRTVSVGMSTGGGTGNLMAGAGYPAELVAFRVR